MPDEPNLKELKTLAQTLKPTVRLGKAGMTPEFLAMFNDAFNRHSLVKLKFESHKEERKTLVRQLAEQSGSRLVQQVGHTAVFYRSAKTIEAAE